ncbi:MAG: hypothetical protein MRY64_02525 [Hyphomonadaceae bacterium]|nr:hypothetical protein [Hyphomonadaceae bacterium]
MPETPFRWNIARREQLGSLLEDLNDYRFMHAEDLAILRRTSARVLAMSNGANLAFIGRSPENFFDYLSGVFEGVEAAPACHLVQFSMRWPGEGGVRALPREKLEGLFAYFRALGLAPADIAKAPAPLALVDFIAYGGTMQTLIALLHLQAEWDGVDWNGVQRRLKIIGLTHRTKNSPNTWRWQQNQDWLDLIPDTMIKNVSVPSGFLFLIANTPEKVTRSHHIGRWDNPERAPLSRDQLRALRLAVDLYDLGRTRAERHLLAGLIARTHQIRQPKTRRLVTALKL